MTTPDTADEIIAAALLMGAELTRTGNRGASLRYWTCGFGYGGYIKPEDAALRYLRANGFELDFNGNLQKI